jgi:hypothetical protein
VLLIDYSMRTSLGVGALIYPTGSAQWSDRAEIRAEVACD